MGTAGEPTHRAVPPPDATIGAFLLQNLFGAWPVDDDGPIQPDQQWRERMAAYAVKAAREAGEVSSWARPNVWLEDRLVEWVDRVTDESVNTPLMELVALTFGPWRRRGGAQGRQPALPRRR